MSEPGPDVDFDETPVPPDGRDGPPAIDDDWDDPERPVKEHAQRGSLKFDGLKLNGFKSFPEPVHLAIEPGMTGRRGTQRLR